MRTRNRANRNIQIEIGEKNFRFVYAPNFTNCLHVAPCLFWIVPFQHRKLGTNSSNQAFMNPLAFKGRLQSRAVLSCCCGWGQGSVHTPQQIWIEQASYDPLCITSSLRKLWRDFFATGIQHWNTWTQLLGLLSWVSPHILARYKCYNVINIHNKGRPLNKNLTFRKKKCYNTCSRFLLIIT